MRCQLRRNPRRGSALPVKISYATTPCPSSRIAASTPMLMARSICAHCCCTVAGTCDSRMVYSVGVNATNAAPTNSPTASRMAEVANNQGRDRRRARSPIMREAGAG